MVRSFALCASAVVLAAGTANAGFGTRFISTSWNSNTVQFLGQGMGGPIGSFTFDGILPNGIATNGSLIWVGTFTPSNTVYAYNKQGVLQFSWSDQTSFNLQGMEYVNGMIAIANNNEVRYHNAFTGAFIGSIPSSGSTTEALAYDSVNDILFNLGDTIDARDAGTGALLYSIPNPAAFNSFGGTGMTYIGGNRLIISSVEGQWYEVDSTTGTVLSSGVNGADTWGLKALPTPGTAALAVMAGALGVIRRRR